MKKKHKIGTCQLVNYSILSRAENCNHIFEYKPCLIGIFFTSIMSENAGCEKLTLNLINIGVQLELLLIIKRGRL